jgi:DNA-binding transcriptional ArsR family regulator
VPISVVGLDEADPARSGPAVCALVEFGSALHVLRDPGHHGSAEWAAGVLAAQARQFADTAARHGSAAALTATDPAVTRAGRGISIAKVASARHDVSRRGLLVAPSGRIAPHLYVADVPGQPLLLIHPVTPGPPAPPVAQLRRRLDTVAHRGRQEVARAIATEPRTAGEIAGLWNLDPALVNRHLRALAAAGLARPTRRGRFVQYQLDAGAVAAVGTDLAALLLR